MAGLNLERLKSAMDQASLDQSALAIRVGCTPGAINQILTGRTRRSRLLPEIAATLGVSLRWLQDRVDNPDDDAIDLTPDEARILSVFRQLPDEDRQALKRVAERMLPSTSHARR